MYFNQEPVDDHVSFLRTNAKDERKSITNVLKRCGIKVASIKRKKTRSYWFYTIKLSNVPIDADGLYKDVRDAVNSLELHKFKNMSLSGNILALTLLNL